MGKHFNRRDSSLRVARSASGGASPKALLALVDGEPLVQHGSGVRGQRCLLLRLLLLLLCVNRLFDGCARRAVGRGILLGRLDDDGRVLSGRGWRQLGLRWGRGARLDGRENGRRRDGLLADGHLHDEGRVWRERVRRWRIGVRRR